MHVTKTLLKVLKDNLTLTQLLDEALGIELSESCAASENKTNTASTEQTRYSKPKYVKKLRI